MINPISITDRTTTATGTTAITSAADGGFKSTLIDEVADIVSKSTTSKEYDLDAIFEKAAATYDVPVKLLKAMAKAESNFNVNAVSSCGAQGIMQLMPATSAALGVTDPFDPEQNIMGGAKYISDKIKKYDGDIKLALAAYQAGSGNVAKYGGVPPFKSTQTYIKNIYNYMGEDLAAGTVTTSGTVAGNSVQNAASTLLSEATDYIDQDASMSFYMILAQSGLLDEYLMLKALSAQDNSGDFINPLLFNYL
ncbi:MAG: lytic transglycosylase domain-containing protein [Firmicutes bacterium]|nr:lytic transglycosylase domain-containing protein [Bacillota bacterium]